MNTIAQLNSALAGRYEIEGEIGAGGMATVYRARDLRHQRPVAVKVLLPELAAIVGTQRFLTEIQVTANLQHPHLLPLFDSGEAIEPGHASGNGLLYYVMPHVDGETLRQRLERERQLSVDEAVRITTAVASALDYAHRRGVIHRDLKPENILLHEGQPLVADFGIALAVSNAAGQRITQTGFSVGTPQYMSPEQAAGDRQLDARSDIYSLATMLYEMLAGQPPHVGPTVQAVLSKVMTEDPRPIDQLRKSVPDHVSAALERALAKVPADRFSRAGELADALAAPVRTNLAHRLVSRGKPRLVALVAGAGLAAGVMLGVAATLSYPSRSENPLMRAAAPLRATIDLPPEAPLALGSDIPPVGYNSPVVALSDDGAWLAWVAKTSSGRLLYIRNMATGEINPLAGTEGAIHPFFSPDAEWVGFLTEDQVKRIPRRGGTVIPLCEAATPVLAWWREPDVIYFTEREATHLSRVSVEAKKKDSVFAGSATLRIDDVLAGGEMLLLSSRIGMSGDYGDILLANLRTHTTDTVIRSGYAARLVDNRLLFARAGTVMAVPFDLKRGKASGEPVPVVEGVTMESLFGMLHVATSSTGVLAFIPGGDLSVGKPAWVDRSGHVEALNVPEQVYGPVDLTPDNTQLAVQVAGVKDYIWVWDMMRGEGRRVVSQAPEGLPLWSPDGRRFASQDLQRDRTVVRTVGVGGPEDDARFVGPVDGVPDAWSPDNVLAFGMWPEARTEFAALDDSTRAIAPVVGWWATFSPDGAWLAITVDNAGGAELFLRSFPAGRNYGQLSTEGGMEARWQPSGNVIYRNGHRWYSIRIVTTSPEPRWDPPQLIFDTDFIDTPGMSWDVSPDEQRLLVVKRMNAPTQPRITILTNWMALTDGRQ